MAWDLAHLPDSNKINPHAVVLAYSWLDGAATSGALDPTYGIPTQGYLSEAATELNGERLAAALEQLTGGSLKGSLQLIGHSHGSKVATVAAVALEESRQTRSMSINSHSSTRPRPVNLASATGSRLTETRMTTGTSCPI